MGYAPEWLSKEQDWRRAKTGTPESAGGAFPEPGMNRSERLTDLKGE